MYLHIGQDTVVRFDDILGIFDIDTSSVSVITREYLSAAQQSGNVINVTGELPKSFVICDRRNGREKSGMAVYISQISTATLNKRAESGAKKGQSN